jgi:hypothetical protein
MRVDQLRAPIAPRDRRLVEWVAQAKVGDALPPPYCYASSPLESVIRNLAILGVIERPGRDETWASMAVSASASAQAWLEAHPAEDDAGAG